jgi:hypothetical protein
MLKVCKILILKNAYYNNSLKNKNYRKKPTIEHRYFKFNNQSFHYNINKHNIIGTAKRRYII